MLRLLSPRRRDESGVVAILVALLAVLLLMFAAYAVDIGLQVNRKNQLNDALDAAAQAGAFRLPSSSSQARTDALAFAKAHDPTEDGTLAPNIDFWCVLASKLSSGSYVVDTTQIPATCNPGTSPYTVGVNYKATGQKISCSPVICAIPCVEPSPNTATPKIACNTIRVYQGRDVPFTFARAGGIQQGSTGNIVSIACKGSCGTINPNPLDVAVVADRTNSMGATDINKLQEGIRGMLQQMTPDQQYVSLGTIGRSDRTTIGQDASCNSTSKGSAWPSDVGNDGQWMPISFSNNYVNAAQTLDESSALVKGVGCLDNQSDIYQGTSLAAPMKAAARYLLGKTANNLSSLPARNTPASKLLIFETDGQPNERQPNSVAGATSLDNATDVFSNPLTTDAGVTSSVDTSEVTSTSGTKVYVTTTHEKTVTYTYTGGAKACQNLLDVAAAAKAQGITVIMIGYNLSSKKCDDYDGVKNDYSNVNGPFNSTGATTTTAGPEAQKTAACAAPYQSYTCVTTFKTETTPKYQRAASSTPVLNVMAAAASGVKGDNDVVTPTTAQSDCSDATEQAAENSDGDYLFCAASGTDMAPIFRTALSQATKGIKLLKMPQ